MPANEIDYPQLIEDALRGVVRRVLAGAAAEGLPGGHHFFLTFATTLDGVELPVSLRERYPEEMTVVLQHQYWDLEVDDERFSVTLRFDGNPQRVTVPFAALRRFVDPEAEVGFAFAAPGGEDDTGEDGDRDEDAAGSPDETDEAGKVLPFTGRRDPAPDD